jgi:GAF domain-containing protein
MSGTRARTTSESHGGCGTARSGRVANLMTCHLTRPPSEAALHVALDVDRVAHRFTTYRGMKALTNVGLVEGMQIVVDEHSATEALLERIGVISRELSNAKGVSSTLQLIVEFGEDLLEQCDGVSMMLIGRGGQIETPASSSRVSYDSDMVQYATGQGPCLDAIRHHETIVMDDLETDERWPEYRAAMLERGVRSMISFRLFVTDASTGALDMYSRRPNAFDWRSQLIGQVFAAQASVAMKAALIEAGLQTAIQSRDVIGQAKGIVMARHRVTADMAFETLKRYSQSSHRKLVDVAAEIAQTGQLPDAND